MLLEKFKSEGLAHLSYMIVSGKYAAVIDPRRDVDCYIDVARREGVNITHIFETHKNEDYVIGSLELAALTKAQIYHGRSTEFQYGNPVGENDLFEVGKLQLQILETPGHTFDSISIVVSDMSFGGTAVAVFTGDALFIGDVGRTDFFPDRSQEVADLLYKSIHEKLLPLGDNVILLPAHGSGSVCGSGMAEREFSTIGTERLCNPLLQKSREEFIEYKTHEYHDFPPYFSKMEEVNQKGAPILRNLPLPAAISAEDLAARMEEGALAIDIRSPEAYAGAHIPGSLSLPLSMLPAFAGWFIPYDKKILLIVDEPTDVETAVRYLIRLGYDSVEGFVAKGVHAWETTGRSYDEIRTIHVSELTEQIEKNNDFVLLDVRSETEFDKEHLPHSKNIYVGKLPNKLGEIPRDKPIVTFCNSGQRALIAASVLKNNGFDDIRNCFGSMEACKETNCELLVQR